jgi:hypothetical protein
MTYRFNFGRDARVNALLGAGHFLSHFYQLCLPPLFIAWQRAFDVSFAELGLAKAVMAGAAAVMQTPMPYADVNYEELVRRDINAADSEACGSRCAVGTTRAPVSARLLMRGPQSKAHAPC